MTEDQVQAFIRDGFVRLENAFSAELAARAREILWRDGPDAGSVHVDDGTSMPAFPARIPPTI